MRSMREFYKSIFLEYVNAKIGLRSFATKKLELLKGCIESYVQIIMSSSKTENDGEWADKVKNLRDTIRSKRLKKKEVEHVFLQIACSHLFNKKWSKFNELKNCPFRLICAKFNTPIFEKMMKQKAMAAFYIAFYDSVDANVGRYYPKGCEAELEDTRERALGVLNH